MAKEAMNASIRKKEGGSMGKYRTTEEWKEAVQKRRIELFHKNEYEGRDPVTGEYTGGCEKTEKKAIKKIYDVENPQPINPDKPAQNNRGPRYAVINNTKYYTLDALASKYGIKLSTLDSAVRQSLPGRNTGGLYKHRKIIGGRLVLDAGAVAMYCKYLENKRNR